MKKMGCVFALAVVALLAAAPAFAFNNATVSFSCNAEDETESGKEFLTSEDASNRELIAWCNDLDPFDPENKSAIKELQKTQSVVIDEDVIYVVECGEILCSWPLVGEGGDTCACAVTGDEAKGSEKCVCTSTPEDFTNEGTLLGVDGTLWCKLYYTWNTEAEKSTFAAKCAGYLGLSTEEDDLPCQAKINTGGEYKIPKSCTVE
jgi:hypothetical protein